MTQTPYNPDRQLLLIYTGGTIGMIHNPETGRLETFNFDHLRKHVPEIKEFGYTIHNYQFEPPIDSSDMTPELWAALVRIIDDNYDRFAALVIADLKAGPLHEAAVNDADMLLVGELDPLHMTKEERDNQQFRTIHAGGLM